MPKPMPNEKELKNIKNKLYSLHEKGDCKGVIEYAFEQIDMYSEDMVDEINMFFEEVCNDGSQKGIDKSWEYQKLLSQMDTDTRIESIPLYESYLHQIKSEAIPGSEFIPDDSKLKEKVAFNCMVNDTSNYKNAYKLHCIAEFSGTVSSNMSMKLGEQNSELKETDPQKYDPNFHLKIDGMFGKIGNDSWKNSRKKCPNLSDEQFNKYREALNKPFATHPYGDKYKNIKKIFEVKEEFGHRESPFVNEDIQKLSNAKSLSEIESYKGKLPDDFIKTAQTRYAFKKDIKKADKGLRILDDYTIKVEELHNALRDDIEYIKKEYENRTNNKERISPEYKAYAESMIALGEQFKNPDSLRVDEFTKALETAQKAANTYSATHKGGLSFKGVHGDGLKRANSSRKADSIISSMLPDYKKNVSDIEKNIGGVRVFDMKTALGTDKDTAILKSEKAYEQMLITDARIEKVTNETAKEYSSRINEKDDFAKQKASLADYAANMLAVKLSGEFVCAQKENYGRMNPNAISDMNEQWLGKGNITESANKIKSSKPFKTMMENVKTPEDIAKMKEMCGRNKGAELLNEMNKGANMVEKQNAQAEKMKQAQKELKPKERQNTVLGHN